MSVGLLSWTIKESFRAYVRQIDDGQELTSDGAKLTGGSVVFSVADEDERSAELTGNVEFSAHGGILHLRMRAIRLTRSGDVIVISMMDPGYRKPTNKRIDFATVVVTDVVRRDEGWTADGPLLTQDGATAFGGYYEAQSRLDRIDLRYANASDAKYWTVFFAVTPESEG